MNRILKKLLKFSLILGIILAFLGIGLLGNRSYQNFSFISFYSGAILILAYRYVSYRIESKKDDFIVKRRTFIKFTLILLMMIFAFLFFNIKQNY